MSKQTANSPLFLVIIAGLLLVFALTAWTAWRGKSPTFDEPLHLVAGWVETHYGDFRCDPEDPPLWLYYAFAGTDKNNLHIPSTGLIWDKMLTDRRVEGLFFRQVLFYTPGNDAIGILADARLRMLLLGVLLGIGIPWWAWRLGGPMAAAIAAAAFCFDPNFLAHSPLVKNDVSISLILLAFMAALWGIGRRASAFRCLALGLTMGLALSVKFSGLLTLPLLLVALAGRILMPDPWPFLKSVARGAAARFTVAGSVAVTSCILAYVIVWGAYRFRFSPAPGQFFDLSEMRSVASKHDADAAFFGANKNISDQQLRQWYAHWQPGVAFRFAIWIGEHRLLPQSSVEGFLFTSGTGPGRAAFLLGTSAASGRWFYFPVAMAVKTPLATLAGLVIAAGYWIVRRRLAHRIWDCLCLTLLPIVYLGVSMASDINIGIRHILPVYPFIFIVLGLTASDALRRFGSPAKIVISLLLLGLIVESFAAYPDYIPFFNIAAGGWENGPNLLGDSNVDWGQELPAIAEWQRQNPKYQLFLAYFGSVDPRYYQIHYVNLPGSSAPEDEAADSSRPRVYAVSGVVPHLPWLTPEAKAFYAGLQSRKPIDVLGHCIYLYNQP